MLPTALALTGVLVTYSGANEIGREKFSDDGKRQHSEISFAGKKFSVTLSRAPRQAIVEVDGKTITREVPAGTLALENGHWQAYALAADEFPDAHEATAVKVLLPGAGMTLDGKIKVTKRPDKSRHVEVTIGPLTVEADVGANGAVTHAAVPLQKIEVKPEGEAAPVVKKRLPPKDVAEEPIELQVSTGTVRGVLWRPAKATGKTPVALFIAGSGPTDRDGNGKMGLATDCYRLLAEALAQQGIASVRYDKRGVGASDPISEGQLTVDDYAADAAALVSRLHTDARFSKVTVIGHSEGGLVALLLAQKTPVDALVLVATAGRPLWQVLHEQLARQHSPAEMTRIDDILSTLREGKPVKEYPKELFMIFRPSIEKYWQRELPLDPVALLEKLKAPVAIVQGETDVQVSIDDAKRLAGARKDAKLSLLPKVNHVLKEEADKTPQQKSYADPEKPLGPGVVAAVLAGIAR